MLEFLAAAALFGQEFDGERVDCRQAGKTDMELRVCYGWYREREEARMQRYLQAAVDAAARRRNEAADLAQRNGWTDDPDPLNQERAWIEASGPAFAAYRDIWCSGVYEAFGRGTARSLAQTDCEIELTHERAKVIWRDYLYNGSEPPVLPEPVKRAWEDEPVASPPEEADE
jgi:uncharacterized protein YecT (DUF1311 family)